jgi:capsule polysaccharide export protein KpsE/RkpR
MNSQLDLSFLRSTAALKRIAAVAGACVVAALAYALLAPSWYRSTLTVVPAKAQRGGGGLSSLLGGDAAGLAAGFLESAGASADGARIAAVLQSSSVSDAVIAKFDLRSRYKERYQETTREELWRHCEIKVLPKPQLVQLSCEDTDPAFAQRMLAFFAEYGNDTFRRVSVSSASEEVRFLEKRVAELRRLADDSATRMREFQETHRIIDLETQAKAVVSAMATLNTQRIGKQLELDYARTFSASDEPSLQQLRSQVSVMGEKLHDLEQPLDPATATGQPAPGGRRGKSVFPAALEVPKLRAEYERLYRDRRVAEAMLIVALERLEGAKANEARDVSTFVVLDAPTLATKKSRPARGLIVAAAALIGVLLGTGLEIWRAGTAHKLLGLNRPQRRVVGA